VKRTKEELTTEWTYWVNQQLNKKLGLASKSLKKKYENVSEGDKALFWQCVLITANQRACKNAVERIGNESIGLLGKMLRGQR
jgi:hypothetical protein